MTRGTGPATWLSADRRDRELRRLGDLDRVDVVVVGGGAVGAGAALDAASRGLSVVLLERGDLASGTSSASSKLIHGGLRYLARGDLPMAWESAREREILMDRVVPHLVRPLPFLTPFGPGFASPHGSLATFGTHLADVLRRAAGSRRAQLPPPRRVTATEARLLTPGLRTDGLDGAVEHWDGQLVDDARLVVALARTAAAYGASILTHCPVDRVDSGVVTGHDRRSGTTFEIHASAVVNATGVWAGRLDPDIHLRPSKGAHLVLPAALLGQPRAGLNVAIPAARNRYVIVLPELDGVAYVGLTDDAIDGEVPDDCQVEPADVRFLLDVLGTALDLSLSPDDVVGGYAGLRPLIADPRHADGATADLSRRHIVTDNGDRLISVVGGKLTTYRRMAADAVDRAVRRYDLRADTSRTARLPLVGAAPRGRLSRLAAPPRLVHRYGAEAPLVTALAEADPRLLAPVAPDVPVLGVELLFGALAEGAVEVSDLLDRRTRCGLVDGWSQAAAPAARDALLRAREPADGHRTAV